MCHVFRKMLGRDIFLHVFRKTGGCFSAPLGTHPVKPPGKRTWHSSPPGWAVSRIGAFYWIKQLCQYCVEPYHHCGLLSNDSYMAISHFARPRRGRLPEQSGTLTSQKFRPPFPTNGRLCDGLPWPHPTPGAGSHAPSPIIHPSYHRRISGPPAHPAWPGTDDKRHDSHPWGARRPAVPADTGKFQRFCGHGRCDTRLWDRFYSSSKASIHADSTSNSSS